MCIISNLFGSKLFLNIKRINKYVLHNNDTLIKRIKYNQAREYTKQITLMITPQYITGVAL